jgi:hypothetical protein
LPRLFRSKRAVKTTFSDSLIFAIPYFIRFFFFFYILLLLILLPCVPSRSYYSPRTANTLFTVTTACVHPYTIPSRWSWTSSPYTSTSGLPHIINRSGGRFTYIYAHIIVYLSLTHILVMGYYFFRVIIITCIIMITI